MSSKEARLNEENVERIHQYQGWQDFEKTLPDELGGHPKLQAIHLGRNRTTHILSCAKCGVPPTRVWDFLISKQESAGGSHSDRNGLPSVNSLRSAADHFKRICGLVLKIAPAKYRAAMRTRLLAGNDIPVVDLTEHESIHPSPNAQHTSTVPSTQSRAFDGVTIKTADIEGSTENNSSLSRSSSRDINKSTHHSPVASGRATTSTYPTPESAVESQQQDKAISPEPNDGIDELDRDNDEVTESNRKVGEKFEKMRQQIKKELENDETEDLRRKDELMKLWQCTSRDQSARKVYQERIASLEHSDRNGAETQQTHPTSRKPLISELKSIREAADKDRNKQRKRKRLPSVEEYGEMMEDSPYRRMKIDEILAAPQESSRHRFSENPPVSGAVQVLSDTPPQALSSLALGTRISEYPAHPAWRDQPTEEVRGGHSHDSPTAAPPSETFSTRRESVSTPRRSSASLSIGEPEALESSNTLATEMALERHPSDETNDRHASSPQRRLQMLEVCSRRVWTPRNA